MLRESKQNNEENFFAVWSYELFAQTQIVSISLNAPKGFRLIFREGTGREACLLSCCPLPASRNCLPRREKHIYCCLFYHKTFPVATKGKERIFVLSWQKTLQIIYLCTVSVQKWNYEKVLSLRFALLLLKDLSMVDTRVACGHF